jgi:hypothetical protein
MRLRATSTCGYLSGVAFNLNLIGQDASFLASPQVLMVRAGMRRLQRQRQTTAKGKLPFTLEMVLAFQTAVHPVDPSLVNSGIAVAMLLAFSWLLRCSEYVPKVKNKHWLRVCDVEFVLADGRVVGSHLF